MPRGLTTAMQVALASDYVRPGILVEATFKSSTVYVWSGIGTVSWNGHSWQGVGSLGNLSTVEESSNVDAKGIAISLSGIDPTLLSDVLGDYQVGLPVNVYLALFDASNAIIADPLLSFAGRMDEPRITMDGQSATIDINCESRLVEMNVAVDRRYTNEDQQLDYPGDAGFAFVNSIQEVFINWGRTPSARAI